MSGPRAIRATCPNRIDLAGGTVDLYPLYLLLGRATTVNLAIDLTSTAEVALIDRPVVEIESVDQQAQGTLAPGEIPPSGPLALAARAVDGFWSGGGLRVTTSNKAPKGSGLGGSSALFVAIASALEKLDGRQTNPHALIQTIAEVEAGLIGIPTGRQDYYAALFGGLQQLEFSAGRVKRREIPLSRRVRDWFDHGMVVAFTGEAHFSGRPNWEVIKAAVEGHAGTLERLRGINEAAARAADALRSSDFDGLCAAIRLDWSHRAELHPEVTSPRLDALVKIALEAGAQAAKLCGAGGGGSLFALATPDKVESIRTAIARHGAQPLDLAPSPEGLRLEAGEGR